MTIKNVKNDWRPPVTFQGKSVKTLPKQGKLTMPLQPWREGVQAASTKAPCPYRAQSPEAWAWAAGVIEGKASINH